MIKFVADNIQITRKPIENALKSFAPDPIRDFVLECEKAGSDMIDINTGPLTRNPVEKMRFFIETVQNTTALPIMIDTANPIAMEAGLAICRNKTIINGFSLEQEKLSRILPLAVKYNSDIVGFLLNPDSSVPRNAQERLGLAVSLYEESRKAGVRPDQLIIDPVLAPLLWNDGSVQAMEVLDVIRTLPELLGFSVKTIVGLSNLTAGAPDLQKKQTMEKAFAAMLVSSGVDFLLMNILRHDTVNTARAASLISRKSIFSWEECVLNQI